MKMGSGRAGIRDWMEEFFEYGRQECSKKRGIGGLGGGLLAGCQGHGGGMPWLVGVFG